MVVKFYWKEGKQWWHVVEMCLKKLSWLGCRYTCHRHLINVWMAQQDALSHPLSFGDDVGHLP
jgi:hypothetical protein